MNIDHALTSATQNPFAVITIIAAPAILTNASSILGLSTGSRFLKSIETINLIERKLKESERDNNVHLVYTFSSQVQYAKLQSQHFASAIKNCHIAMGTFTLSCFTVLTGSAFYLTEQLFLVKTFAIISLLSGLVGMSCLTYSCLRLYLASRCTMKIINSGLEFAK